MIVRQTFQILCACVLAMAAHCAAEEPVKFPLPRPSEIGAEKFAATLSAFLQQGGYASWKHDAKPRFTGPYFVRASGEVESFGTHGPSAVKVYYSPEVWKWMNDGYKGLIPDGGTIVKVLYARNPDEPTKYSADPTGFSVMVKDSKGSWDGWFYSDGGPLTKPVAADAGNFFDPNAGFALSCINCHATTANVESTYSSLRNVTGEPFVYAISLSREGMKKKSAPNDIHNPAKVEEPRENHGCNCPPYFSAAAQAAAKIEPPALPFVTLDHVPQGPRPDGQRMFVTSSNCSACHDAVQLNATKPNMAFYEEPKPAKTGESAAQEITNLSPYSEWRYSLMGLAGRDPVFLAQLESERALYPQLAERIDHNCLSCHAVMAQRQFSHDKGPAAFFTQAVANAAPGSAHATYGALARDGVSCMVCHQILPDGLGSAETFSGKFKLPEKSTQIFGPYAKPAQLPMQQAIGLTPVQGTQMTQSNLCASCHTISTPSLDAGKKYSAKEFDAIANSPSASFHEQTTYLEWKNSSFSTEKARPESSARSCQDCHMPRSYKNKALRFKVANIEDDTFPPVDQRAPDGKIHMEPRDKYSRHSLQAINLHVLELFKQNPWLMGVPSRDNLLPSANAKPGFDVALESAAELATEQTATVHILNLKRNANKLTAQVQVENLAGHKFPSGVSFRRAFLEFKVLAGDKSIWASGATDAWGVIGANRDGKFTPLDTEFFKDNMFQPHHRTITREDQVQIYEELVADSNGVLTSSFLQQRKALKDNRLLPRGWKSDGPDAEITQPTGTDDDPDYRDGTGKNVVTYEVPLTVPPDQLVKVTATLYYQSLPPYYLKRRSEQHDLPETQRFNYLVSHFEPKGTALSDWKLKVAGDEKNAGN
ncbi:MAG TPA: cytochrome P460 family protein [Planctomycetota bacterium]|nr:cytochrome P460 family protein [Planctomycetota bacterium]